LQARGAIYYHSSLKYLDGQIGIKYLILLNTPIKNEPYLFLKTTSQKKDKPSIPACIPKYKVFFIAAGGAFFWLDTWVQLHELYEFTPIEVDTNKDITVVGSLDTKIIDAIIDCLFKSEEENIAHNHKKLLRPQLQDSLLKLKEKFNKKR